MTNKKIIANLEDWLKSLIKKAEEDDNFLVSWFDDTKDDSISLVGGWSEGFSEDFNDILYISKSSPSYALCVKIAVNDGPYAYVDFDTLDMPTSSDGTVEDTCIVIERNEDISGLASFLNCELERIAGSLS